MKPKRNLEADLTTLELTQSFIESTLGQITEADPDVWAKRTDAFHDLVKSARKTQLKRWHPDVCKAPEAVARSAEINAAADGLLTLRILPKPVARPVFRRVVIINGYNPWGDFSMNSSTGTSTWTDFATGAWQVWQKAG